MIFSITMRNLNSVKNSIHKYACCLMYFFETDKNDQAIFVEIIKEMHLINNLKINLLINNDILKLEFIDIFISINTTFIENCDVIISNLLKSKSFSQTKAVHATKSINILSHSKFAISIHKIVVLERDHSFEFKEIANFVVYAHLIDNDIKAVLVRNDDNKLIQISRNFRLKNLIEIDFSNALHIDTTYAGFTFKKLKCVHKSFWFTKVFNYISVFYIDTENNILTEKKHSNNVTIHDSSKNVVKVFIKIIDDYSNL